MSDQIITRVELLENATLTVIHNQNAVLAELKNVNSRLDRMENLLQLVMQTINERLPGPGQERRDQDQPPPA